MLSDLGKLYLKAMHEGKVCKCMYLHGELCPDCVRKQKKRQTILDRNKKINKIFGN